MDSVEEWLKKYLERYECDCWLIGSRARGDYTEHSDWDVSCVCENPEKSREFIKVNGNKIAIHFFEIGYVPPISKLPIFAEGVKLTDNLGIEFNLTRDEVVEYCIEESRRNVGKLIEWLNRHEDDIPFYPDFQKRLNAINHWLSNLKSINKTCRLALEKVKHRELELRKDRVISKKVQHCLG